MKLSEAGSDGIHSVLTKKCSVFNCSAHLLNKSMKQGCFPVIWKTAWVSPIPKGPISQDIEKYRPISKLCQFSKLFEKIVTEQLFASVHRYIIPNQHGFYKGRSVDSNLLVFTTEIINAMDNGYNVDAVYTDFAKAFDKICHRTLLTKLWQLGIHGDLFRWICSYVKNRNQCVVLSGFMSQKKSVSSGVPDRFRPFTFYIIYKRYK